MEGFADRVDAGRRLAALLGDRPGAVVVGLARGGVVVADEVAGALGLDLDVLVVRKVGVPEHEEVAMGAVAEGGVEARDDATRRMARVTGRQFDAARDRERDRLERRVARYRARVPALSLAGRAVVCVDDGVATGATALAALRALAARGAAHLTLAVPVAAAAARPALERACDELVVAVAARGEFSVGQHYREFPATADGEVVARLEAARARRGGA